MKIEIDLQLPTVPNYILHKAKPGRRQDGFHEAEKTDVGDLHESTLRQIGAEWTEELVAKGHDRKRRTEER